MAGEQYIGCKIWLISTLNIRYEGILHSIDSNEATLALSQVRAFGTEDRAEVVIPPKDDVYDLILFRASNIKDIKLCDPPKPAPPPERPAPYDPAIIQVQSNAPGMYPGAPMHHHPGAPPPIHPGAPVRPGPFVAPSYSGYGGYPPNSGMGPNLMPSGPAPSLGQSPVTFSGIGVDLEPVGPPPHPDGPNEDEPVLPSSSLKSGSTTPLIPSESGVDSRKASESEGKQEDAGVRAVGGQRYDNKRGSRGRYDNRYDRDYSQRDHEDRREGGGYRGGRGGYEHRGGRGGPRGGYHRDQNREVAQNATGATAKPAGGNKLKFDQEFDFERANQDFERVLEKLSKTKISDTADKTEAAASIDGSVTDAGIVEDKETPAPEAEPPCYNKTKSFFDSISCEAIERSKGGYQRPDWNKERQLNVETFGIKPRGGGYRGGYNQGYNQNYGGYRGYNRGNYYRNNYQRDNRDGYQRENRDGYQRDNREGYQRDNREGYQRDNREGYQRDNQTREYREGYNNRDQEGYNGYRGNRGGYTAYHDGRGRGRGANRGYRGGRGRSYEDSGEEKTERAEKPEGRSERGRGSYASRV